MYADLDELVLSGKLFNGSSRSSSPERSPSPDSKQARWPGDGNDEYEKDADYSSDVERQQRISRIINAAPSDAPEGAIGMGPGRTGVKGVIRDRAEAQARAREKKNAEIRDLNTRMEKASLRAQTYLEEEQERELERIMLEGAPSPLSAPSQARDAMGKGKPRFGHLREVGVKNFVSAVEREDRGVWVLVHLYDPSLDRCYDLDNVLSRLSRSHPNTKFLRARAAALGFASTSSSSFPRLSSSAFSSQRGLRSSKPLIEEEDENDPYSYDEKDITDLEEDDENDREDSVDTDVLPTLLAYRDGELQHTWVRVDWEAGKLGVEDLLERHHILGASGTGNCGLPPDDLDDTDLWNSD